jgi:hypothetical protein
MAAFRVGPLPEGAVEAAATFYAEALPLLAAHAGEDLVLIFPPAAHDHRGWRLSAVQDLARAAAPGRVNGIVGDDEDAIAETIRYLERAPGVTGQLLVVGPG